MQRLIQGERVEDVLSRDELRQLGKNLGKAGMTELFRQGKDAILDDHAKKNADWNARMNDFSRNLNEHLRQQTTLYKEEKNVANKEKIEDRRGLWNAYSSPTGLYKSGRTLYISGTGGKNGSLVRDVVDDIFLLPTRNAHYTEKYRDTMAKLHESPEIDRLVGHSLSSAVINKINEQHPNKYVSTTYATPTIKWKRKGKQNPKRLDLRNPADVISILDGYAETSDLKEMNPLMAHSYINFENQGSLNFGLPETAQYITDRRHVNYFPSGSNVYNPNAGNKNIRFYISGEDNTYLDLSSVRLFANLQNTDGTRSHFLRPLGGLSAFMQRYRCSIGGQLIQDIVEYNRHCELYNSFKSKDVREMDEIESSANPSFWNDYHDYANGLDEFLKPKTTGDTPTPGVVTVDTAGNHNKWGKMDKRYTRHSVTGIPGANGYARFGHKPVCGVMESNYYLPLRYSPLELEFTIVNNEQEPVITPFNVTDANTQNDDTGYYFTTGDTSTSWELNNVIIRAEVIHLDNTVNNNIVKHLLEGQSLKLVFPIYHTISQSFNNAGTEINMNIVKSASKLNGCFITLYRAPKSGVVDGKYLPDNYVYKRWNYQYNPMINAPIVDGVDPDGANPENQGRGFQDSLRNLSWQIQIGSKKYPEFECQSLAETMYFLRRAIHYLNPDQDALSFSYKQYRHDKFVIGMSYEKMQDINFSGVNTKMGSLLTFKLKGTNQALQAGEEITEIFTHLINESVAEIRQDGVILYD
eukprot:Skav204780  [mRNA]  locus=scaffold763:145045:148438:- [translate_table: standard]